MFKSRPQLIWLATGIGTLIYLLIKHSAPVFLTHLHAAQAFHLLNLWAGSNGQQPLNFYLGTIEQRWLGSILNAFAMAIFLPFAWHHLKDKSARAFALAVFLFLLITKFEIMLFPPYGDSAGGAWVEAIWLVNHNFNYQELLRQPEFVYGGPKVYFFSLYPTFIAVLMKICPWPNAFLILNHTIIFAMAAVIVSTFRNLLNKSFGPETALLGSFCLLSLPLFQSLTELLNMEIPCLFFALLAIDALIKHKFGKASLWAILSAFTKGPGIIVCVLVFTVGLIQFLFSREGLRFKKRVLFYGLLALGFAVITVLSKGLVTTSNTANNQESLFSGFNIIVRYSPLLVYSYLCILAALLVRLIQRHWLRKKNAFTDNAFVITGIMFLCATFWFGLYVNFPVLIPRYKLLLAPSLIFGLIFLLKILIRNRAAAAVLLLLAIFTAQWATYGFFYKKAKNQFYFYIHTERSLEYRNDLRLYMNVVKELQTNYSDNTVGAPFILAQALSLPQLGYVSRPMDIFVYGMSIKYGGIKNYEGLKNLNIYKTIWVSFEDGQANQKDYPIGPQDLKVADIMYGEKKATLFRGGFEIEKRYRYILLKKSLQQL